MSPGTRCGGAADIADRSSAGRITAMLAFGFAMIGDAVSGFLVDHVFIFMLVRFLTGIGAGAAYVSRYRFLVSGSEFDQRWVERCWKEYAAGD